MSALATPKVVHTATSEVWYVAAVDDDFRPVQELSGLFANRMEALPRLLWARKRYPNARLVREAIFREITED